VCSLSHHLPHKFHQEKSEHFFFKSKLILYSFANNHIPLQGGVLNSTDWKCQWKIQEWPDTKALFF
jgi:hypothetical protein